jgi:methionyl-tRNA synthetase
MSETFVVTATPPTPNGDFHVGHLAGPYLGADIFARYQKLRGNTVVYVCSADLNQSYVVTTGERLAIAPDVLAAKSYREMVQTLELGRIGLDVFNQVDSEHVAAVQDFFRRIEARGYVSRKTVRVPYAPSEGRFLFESFVAGHCPECWAPTAGAICETCGHPNDFATLDLAHAKTGGPAPEFREVEIAVLELERFREQFESYYAAKRGHWRPHLIELVDELLSRRLPDYPLTYPADWGIPAPFAGFEGQVVNVWAEMLPGLIQSTELAGAGGAWTADSRARVVQFLGYDNSFFFAVVHPALAWAHGDCRTADTIVTNEFFELDNFKFSTSKGHLIWARDLLAEETADVTRFYLALANPETQKQNFNRSAMQTICHARLLDPIDEALEQTRSAAERLGYLAKPFVLTPAEAGRLDRVLDRFAAFHEPAKFSPQRIAEHLSQLLVRLAAGAAHAKQTDDVHELRWCLGVLARVLPAVTKPLMPDYSDTLARSFGQPPVSVWPRIEAGTEVTVPPNAFAHAARIPAVSIDLDEREAS